ncbi:hypothetical protein [Nitratifractor salsuginis]|uniref:hypothetical protein n=1 Tax=Nitratifractor salsuginis TaxID=269261 RepID=UPI0005A909EE|nr:hypothetical protein [Nitratifractor salsuginis]
MCKAYDATAKLFDEILRVNLIKKNNHLSYDEFIHIIKNNSYINYPYDYSTRETIFDRLEYLRASGEISLDEDGKYYRSPRKQFFRKRSFFSKRKREFT